MARAECPGQEAAQDAFVAALRGATRFFYQAKCDTRHPKRHRFGGDVITYLAERNRGGDALADTFDKVLAPILGRACGPIGSPSLVVRY